MRPKDKSLLAFRDVAWSQILPAICLMLFVSFITFGITHLFYYGLFPRRRGGSINDEEMLALALIYPLTLFLLSGGGGILYASYLFIQGYQKGNPKNIFNGFKALNWGMGIWLLLSASILIFIAVMFSADYIW